MAALAQSMSDMSGGGILVQDKRGLVLADQPSMELQGIWDVILESLGELTSLPEPLLDRKEAGDQNPVIVQEIPGDLHRLVSPITVGSVVRGYLSMVGTIPEKLL